MPNNYTVAMDANNSSVVAHLFNDAYRIAFSHDALNAFAKKIAREVDDLNGESKKFEVDFNGVTAEIEYSAEHGYDEGDYFTGPCQCVDEDIVRVIAVYENDGEGREFPEVAEYLEAQLN